MTHPTLRVSSFVQQTTDNNSQLSEVPYSASAYSGDFIYNVNIRYNRPYS